MKSLALSQDQKILVSGGDDQTVRIWDAATGFLIETSLKHTTPVLEVIINGDQRQSILSVGRDLMVQRSILKEDRYKFTPFTCKGRTSSLAVSAEAGLVVAGGQDSAVRVWDLKRRCQLKQMVGHAGLVLAVAICPDGIHALSAGSDREVRLWNIAKGTLVRTLLGHTLSVNALAVSQDSCRIVSGSSDQSIRVWDFQSGKLVHVLSGHTDSVKSVSLSARRACIISGSCDGTVRLWSLEKGHVLATLSGNSSGIASVALLE